MENKQGRNTGVQQPRPKPRRPTTGPRYCTRAISTEALSAREQHPGTSCLPPTPKRERQPPSFETPANQPTPKRRSPRTRVPTPGTDPRHRSVDGQRPAPWHRRSTTHVQDADDRSPETRSQRSTMSTEAPLAYDQRPDTSHQRLTPKHRAPKTGTEAPSVDSRRRDTDHRHPAPKHRAPTTDTEAPTDDRLPCGFLPFDVFPE